MYIRIHIIHACSVRARTCTHAYKRTVLEKQPALGDPAQPGRARYPSICDASLCSGSWEGAETETREQVACTNSQCAHPVLCLPEHCTPSLRQIRTSVLWGGSGVVVVDAVSFRHTPASMEEKEGQGGPPLPPRRAAGLGRSPATGFDSNSALGFACDPVPRSRSLENSRVVLSGSAIYAWLPIPPPHSVSLLAGCSVLLLSSRGLT